MQEIFYYVKNESLNNYLNYGIKLSENYDRKLIINDLEKLYMSGLLNPKDDLEKFNNREEYTCVRITLDNINLKIVDNYLYNTKYYESSIINLSEYKLGNYIKPEVLIPVSILPENIEEINYEIDFPLLYDNSNELYVNNLIENISLTLPNSDIIKLRALLEEFARVNNLKKETINGKFFYISGNGNMLYL